LHIHQYDAKRLPFQRRQWFAAVAGHCDGVATFLQQTNGQHLIDQVILGQQDLETPRTATPRRLRYQLGRLVLGCLET
jgi:hypothetical protein